MIDDYNATEHLLDIPNFLRKLTLEGVEPDYYAYEADMQKYSDKMLGIIQDKKVRKSYSRYIDGNGGKLPCSFMTSIWYLIRLGIFDADEIVKSEKSAFKPADTLINILPERFRSVESMAIKLIGSSKHSNAISKIDYVFFGDNGHA
jgi:hypothetical protein